jgi:hypothetical protein
MLKRIFHICLTICFGVTGAAYSQSIAQQPSITRPILTFVLDSSHQLRPLLGIPGSAAIGASVNLGFDITQAAMPPNHDYILAATSQSSWPALLRVQGNSVINTSAQSLLNPLKQPDARCASVDDPDFLKGRKAICRPTAAAADPGTIDSIALSPAGSAAALLNRAAGRVYVFGNLSQAPTLLQIFNIADAGSVSTLGISDDGKSLLVGTSTGDTGSVFLVTPDTPARLLGSMRHPSSVAFLHNSVNAVIADDMGNTIYAWSNGQIFILAGANDGISAPIGIAVSNDNQKTFVGNAQTGTVTTIGSDGTLGTSRPCNCNLTGVYSTNTDSVFRLTDFSGGPILLFDASGASPRMIFVPVAAE